MASPFAAFVFVFGFVLLISLADASIRVDVDVDEDEGVFTPAGILENHTVMSYNVVNDLNETLFRGGDLAVFMYGTWCVAPPKQQSSSLSSPSNSTSTETGIASRPLIFKSQETVHGTKSGLGKYDGVRIRWSCSLIHWDENGDRAVSFEPIVTSFLNFESQRAVVFDIEFPDGAENTSLALFHNDDDSDGDSDNDSVTATLATFPSFVMATSSSSSGITTESSVPTGDGRGEISEEKSNKGSKKSSETNDMYSYFPPTLPTALSWEGSFVQSVRRLSTGARGGPTVFYNASDPSLKTVVVASPFFPSINRNNNLYHRRRHHWNSFTAGNNKDWTGQISAFSPGMSGRIKTIPIGSSQSIILYEGRRGGITATLEEWGNIMQTASSLDLSSNSTSISTSIKLLTPVSSPSKKIKDVTLEKIGYQTDNGAMYCFCRQSNCSEVLLQEKEYLDSIRVPIGYLSYQGAGTSSGRGKAAPWCIERWSADGGQDPKQYPLDTKTFQQALGVPLQLYAPYFCPNSTKYFQPYTPWKSVSSNPQLPGCSDFAFDTVNTADSKDFFSWFMKKGIENYAAGMASFESDFMNQNVNCVNDFVETVAAADDFLAGMADAALELNVPIQWCYASPNVLFASLDFPAVTNFRVSFDFCYGRSWEIGESSLLVWALGAAPSKDTLWTTNNNKTETPGCAWTVDHESIAAELHVVLALMSTGPVGISDAIGMTNTTLLQRIISKDGSLLQPTKPITAVDSSFLDIDESKLDGYLYGTYGLGPSWIFVSFQLRSPFSVTLRDFWPPVKAESSSFRSPSITRLVYRIFGSSSDCLDGADAIQSGCITMVSLNNKNELNNRDTDTDNISSLDDSTQIFVAPSSSFDESPGSDLSPSIVTVWQETCPQSGVFFLGELDKYVALSPKRFQSLICTEQGISVTIQGTEGEVVEITILVPHSSTWYEVLKQNITIADNSKLARFDFRVNDPLREAVVA